jgi:cell division protease FtsH
MSQQVVAIGKPTTAEKQVPRFLHEFVKSYVYRLYTGELKNDVLQVIGATAVVDAYTRRPQPITVSDELHGRFIRVADALVVATVRFLGEEYHLTMFFEVEHMEVIRHFVYVLGLRGKSTDATTLLEYLLKESVAHSPYRNCALLARSEQTDTLSLLELVNEEDRLEDIFLPDAIQRHISLFVNAVKGYTNIRKPVRYLLSGKPGTGKTKIIRAVAKACEGYATFLFANGSEKRIDELFDTAAMFSPVVVCLDDIDMLTGSREESMYTRQLATLLQRLDGFNREDFFLLATTNDKRLVDLAASRPGRFDKVIDVSTIEPGHYLSLVKSKVHDARVISLFGEPVLEALSHKRVSGAFISNLVKHLELIGTFEPERLDEKFVLQAIEESHRGFYRPASDSEKKLGFRAA